MRYLYCHGFASGPSSQKARWFAQQFAAQGHELIIPDLNRPSFKRLTISAQITYLQQLISMSDEPWYLLGSSLGGLVALHAAATIPQIERLVLLAPALYFAQNRRLMLGEATINQWQTAGWLEFYNYRDNALRAVHYGLIEDAEAYNSDNFSRNMPILIVHGTEDESVSHTQSQRFAQPREYVRLHTPSWDHGMLGHVAELWALIEQHLG
ncbi:YqiA/YcfP family alpha/beta fold hydrolase [Herpetosiphon gulosus]|uniref:Esterase n=1 Tax=Herpetosiphon gulosus TaxID=1973496 RepID=A0ABP9WUM0_9CHLR